jgi:Tfp pilus assembly protein FimT
VLYKNLESKKTSADRDKLRQALTSINKSDSGQQMNNSGQLNISDVDRSKSKLKPVTSVDQSKSKPTNSKVGKISFKNKQETAQSRLKLFIN